MDMFVHVRSQQDLTVAIQSYVIITNKYSVLVMHQFLNAFHTIVLDKIYFYLCKTIKTQLICLNLITGNLYINELI